MYRRHVIAAASTAAVPLLLAMGRTANAQDRMAPAGSTLGATQHKMMTLQVGSLSLQLSNLALQRAKNPKVREFAGFERDEQMTIAQVLTDTENPTPVELNRADAALLQKQSAVSGADFDELYLTNEVQGHTKLLQIQQEFLQSQPAMTSDAAHISMLARTVIQMHLKMLADLQSELRT